MKSGDTQQRLLYPISAAPPYPTASQVQAFLNKSRITETQLTVEHVEMLLNVLVLDGEIEKVRSSFQYVCRVSVLIPGTGASDRRSPLGVDA